MRARVAWLIYAAAAGALAVVVAGSWILAVARRGDAEPGFERQRWHPDLIAAVLERYHMPRRFFGLCPAYVWCRQLYVYVPR